MEQIEVRILDRNFKLQVPAQERERLMRAVQIVDRKMREIRDAGRAQGTDRIAVNAALQLVYEFLGREASVTTATGTGPTLADDEDTPTEQLAVADDAPGSDPTSSPALAATAAGSATPASSTGPAVSTPASHRTSSAVANKAHTASGHAAPSRHGASGRVDAARSEVQASSSRDAAKAGASKRDTGKGDQPATSIDTSEPLGNARIEEISKELEAEIRRQENLF